MEGVADIMDYPKKWDQLPKRERKKKIRELKKQQEKRGLLIKKLRSWGISLVVLAVVAGGGYYWLTNREVLPPTDISGHIEQSPSSHVLDSPMGPAIQKHMLEHADGDGPPGVVINYNCEDFECEQDLKEKLAEFANEYPEFVYVAPYPGMTKKLAITRYQKIEVFDSLDKEALVGFIEEK